MDIKKLNISDDLLDENIYRIIPFDRFMEMLENKINVLVRPHLWDDPFENLLTYPSHARKNEQYRNEKYYIYAQCWSFSGENDLLWRAYSQNSDSVRIKSTPRKLIDSICNSNRIFKIEDSPNLVETLDYPDADTDADADVDDVQIFEYINGFIGSVEYLPTKRIEKLLSEIVKKYNLDSFYKTLFIKREAFRNEEELRVGIRHFYGFHEDILELSTGELFEYDININKVIDEVVFDPRISDYKFKGLKIQIKKYGFQNPVLKSNLYDIPEIDEILE